MSAGRAVSLDEMNRDARMAAHRILSDKLKQVTDRGGFWGCIGVKLIIEDSRPKLVVELHEESRTIQQR